ncbi:hypothetical protein B9Z65_6702 [Elsinoe australis]|uniref:Uncharacterized protein n=1 Tax=Elsinoe australis TaxID=40998 RepID=A0A2P8ADX6_9PEZI|nr:hypothetical protein B9Z65_6702 [Elsinoe australis]
MKLGQTFFANQASGDPASPRPRPKGLEGRALYVLWLDLVEAELGSLQVGSKPRIFLSQRRAKIHRLTQVQDPTLRSGWGDSSSSGTSLGSRSTPASGERRRIEGIVAKSQVLSD